MRVSVGAGPFRFHGWSALLLWCAGWALAVVGAVTWRHPRTAGAVAAVGAVGWWAWAHPTASLAVVLAAEVGGHLWWLTAPGSFRRWVVLPAMSVWRAAFVYRRRWPAAVRAAGLVGVDERLPRLVAVRCRPDVDVLRVRAVLGQTAPQWEDAAPMLAHVFGAADYRLARGDARRLTLELRRARQGRAWDRRPVRVPAGAGW